MKQIALFIGSLMLFTPGLVSAQAQTPSCSAQGYTVVFVNGVFDTETQARADKNQLELTFDKENKSEINGQPITFQLGYNPTHLAGLGDSLQSTFQQFNSSLSNFDLDTILMQIYPEVTTRKLLVVGHSQGADYANEMYDYLLAHGEPKEAVGVYAVGTPAHFVAGAGKYITSTNDKVINWVAIGAAAARAQLPLPGNVTLPLSVADQTSIIGGHSFTDDYLANASTQMVSDISGELSALIPTDSTQSGDCFTPPDASVGYKAQQALFAVGDPTATVLKVGGVTLFDGGVLALKAAATLAVGAFQFVADAVTFASAPPSDAQATQKTDTIINKLYGSSLDGLSPQDKKELLGNSQGSAVALALNGGFVEGTSTSIATSSTPTPSIVPQTSNGLSWGGGGSPTPTAEPPADTDEASTNAPVTPPEQFDQFDASTTPPVLSVSACARSLSPDFCFVPTTSVTLAWTAVDNAQRYDVEVNGSQNETTTDTRTIISLPDEASSTIQIIAYDASSTPLASNTQTVYVFTKPVVINEVAWDGTYPSPTDQWIELKNRTPYLLDVSKLTLLAEQGGAQYVPLTGMINGDFYVLERTQTVFNGFNVASNFAGEFAPLDTLGEQLALAWSGGDATTKLDETPAMSTCNGWCAGSMAVPTGYALSYGALEPISMERISADISGTLASNWANNDGYAQGVSGLPEQRIVGSPGMENSSHWPMAGFYCDGDTSVLVPTTGTPPSYTPKSLDCNFLAGFVLPGDAVVGGLYHGVMGSSTLVNPTAFTLYGSVSKVTIAPLDPIQRDYFIAYWELNTSVSANYNAFLSPDMSSYLTTGAQTDGITTTPPPLNLVVIPFTYAP